MALAGWRVRKHSLRNLDFSEGRGILGAVRRHVALCVIGRKRCTTQEESWAVVQRVRKHINPATGLAFVALIFAMTGGAFGDWAVAAPE